MAKQRLFPKTDADDKRQPHERFNELAASVVKVPKTEIDAREKQWRKAHTKRTQ